MPFVAIFVAMTVSVLASGDAHDAPGIDEELSIKIDTVDDTMFGAA